MSQLADPAIHAVRRCDERNERFALRLRRWNAAWEASGLPTDAMCSDHPASLTAPHETSLLEERLLQQHGSLRLEVGPMFFEDLRQTNV